jgi:hypothetical protein
MCQSSSSSLLEEQHTAPVCVRRHTRLFAQRPLSCSAFCTPRQVLSCYHPEDGGFGASPRNDSHMLPTLSALQILALLGELHRVDADAVAACEGVRCSVLRCGGVRGGAWRCVHPGRPVPTSARPCVSACRLCWPAAAGRLVCRRQVGRDRHTVSHAPAAAAAAATALHTNASLGWTLEYSQPRPRFTYCALLACSILGRSDALDVAAAVEFIQACKNFDGGFGCTAGTRAALLCDARCVHARFVLLPQEACRPSRTAAAPTSTNAAACTRQRVACWPGLHVHWRPQPGGAAGCSRPRPCRVVVSDGGGGLQIR